MIAKDFAFYFINAFSSFFFLGRHICIYVCIIAIPFKRISPLYVSYGTFFSFPLIFTAFFAGSIESPSYPGQPANDPARNNQGMCGYPTCMEALALNLGIILGSNLVVGNITQVSILFCISLRATWPSQPSTYPNNHYTPLYPTIGTYSFYQVPSEITVRIGQSRQNPNTCRSRVL